MNWPRVRIFDLMGLITLAAINCLPVRLMATPLATSNFPYSLRFAALGITPVASLLIVLMVKMLRDVRRTGEARPFHLGFVVFGLAAMVGAALSTSSEDWIYEYFEIVGKCLNWMLKPLLSSGPSPYPRLESAIEYVLIWLCLVVPQVIVATVGGFVVRRSGLTIARSRAAVS